MNDTTVSREDYEELSGHLEYFHSKCNQLEEEIQYMHDFIRWMHLGKMYDNFRKHAMEVQPKDEPFPYYTMSEDDGLR